MDFLLPCSLQCTPNKKFHKKRRTPSTFSTPVSHRYRLFLSFFLFFFFCSRCLTTAEKKFPDARLYAVHIFAHCKTKQYTRLNIDSHILNGVWWNLAGAGDWGDCASLFLRLWHMSCWAGGAPLSISTPHLTTTTFSLYLTARERNMLSFYALHSLLVPVLSLYHCSISAYQ